MGSLIAAILAVGALGVVLQDAFEVMLLPRRVHRQIRLTRFYFKATWAAWSTWALLLPSGQRRERFLSVFGALSMVVLFALWATTLIAGFGLLEWILQGPLIAASSLTEETYMSAVTFFTLGYGDVVPHTAAARLVAVIEAGTGLGLIAIVIGYLPVLYQLFSRREAHVIQLDARAGSPPTATTMLSRHAESGGLSKLDDLLREWEIWGSELLESHLSYPMLVYYRSQHDNQSWLAAIAAIMDSCALILVGVDELPPLQARMTFTMARQVLVEIARSVGVRPSRYDGGDRLPHEEYVRIEAIFSEVGLKWSGGRHTEETLTALRATYEPLLDGLGLALLLPLPSWIGALGAADHWQRGHRGLIASRLIEQLSDRTRGDINAESREGNFAQRLRTRLNRE
jgi:voltage-gated potassium channel Kch